MAEMLIILIIGLVGIGFIADHYYSKEKIDKLERDSNKRGNRHEG